MVKCTDQKIEIPYNPLELLQCSLSKYMVSNVYALCLHGRNVLACMWPQQIISIITTTNQFSSCHLVFVRRIYERFDYRFIFAQFTS